MLTLAAYRTELPPAATASLRGKQKPPEGDWSIWLLLAGRGFGKTLTGARWINRLAQRHVGCRIAIVGRTAADVRDVMIEGETGILATNPDINYEPSKRRLTWPNGSTATTFTADKPDQLRGPQHHFAWCDELATWRYTEAWDMLMLGLRLGQHPRALITTTPRPIPIIRELLDRDGQDVSVVRGTTFENIDNLAPTFRKEILHRYEGTRLGRQELHAELLEDVPGALWTRAMIDELRMVSAPTLVKAAVAIDPAVTAGAESDETGIVVGGVDENGHGYVINDLSGVLSPEAWARRAVNAYQTEQLNLIIGEVNNGGDLIENTIRTLRTPDGNKLSGIKFKAVRAAKGKYTRAEPVAALYEQNRIHHVGSFPELEDQMCTWVPGDKSPDRLDALVWLFTELMVGERETVWAF